MRRRLCLLIFRALCGSQGAKNRIKEWTIDVCATMQESESKQVGKEAEVGFYTLFFIIVLGWDGMGHYNESH